jgi:hypothetical protein
MEYEKMTDEPEGMWEEFIEACLKAFSQHIPGRLKTKIIWS